MNIPIDDAKLLRLRELAKELRTQDNAATSHPLFLVQEQRYIYGMDLDYDPPTHWVEKFEREIFYANDEKVIAGIREDDHDNALANLDDSEIDPAEHGYELIGYHVEWRYVCAHFTRTAAERYITENAHNLTLPRVYVASQYRCPEWQLVVETLGPVVEQLIELRSAVELKARCPRCQGPVMREVDADNTHIAWVCVCGLCECEWNDDDPAHLDPPRSARP